METINTAIIMAQGGNVDSGGFKNWIGQWGDALQTWIGVIVGIVALLFAGINIMKALKDLNNKKQNDAVKHFVYAGIIVLVAIIGVGGLYGIIETIKPVDGNGVTDYLQ